jgi:hypothetical protein
MRGVAIKSGPAGGRTDPGDLALGNAPSLRGCVAGSDVPPQDVGGEVGVLVAGGDVKGEAEAGRLGSIL